MLNTKSIGNKIAEARKKNGLSQAELAQQVSISPQAVGKWERGESMPDISTLNKIAIILGVDLNYFSDNFQPSQGERRKYTTISNPSTDRSVPKPKKDFDWNWDMSRSSWFDADFSGLKNLKEKFSSSSLNKCKFLNSELSGLIFSSNEIINCEFSGSDLRNSKIHSSEINKNTFVACSFIDAEFKSSEIRNCDFSKANFSGAIFISSEFVSNKVDMAEWKLTSFKTSDITDITFEGTIEDCSFENCSFKGVKFQNATIINTFFKDNRKLSRVQFIDCKVDKLTYAFLKNGKADLTGITLLNS
jgi:transcriptional regulator with XRE-family HTH domain